MKQFIKLETGIMYNPRVRRLYVEKRQAGLCLYIMLRLHIEGLSDEGIPLQEALAFGKSYYNNKGAESIIRDYGLFDISDDRVRPLSLEEMEEMELAQSLPAGTQVDGQVGGQVDGQTPVPIEDENRKEKNKKKDEDIVSEEEKEWRSEFAEHYPTLARMRKPLTLEEYNRLLTDHPNARIIEKLERMENLPDVTKKYVSTYRTLRNWLRTLPTSLKGRGC